MLDRSLEEMRVTLLATVAGRIGAPGDAFEPIDVFAALPANAKLLRPRMNVSVEFVRIVECRDHNMSTLSAIRVVAIVRNDPAGNGVIVGIHLGHAGSIRLPGSELLRARGCREHYGFVSMVKHSASTNVGLTGDRRA